MFYHVKSEDNQHVVITLYPQTSFPNSYRSSISVNQKNLVCFVNSKKEKNFLSKPFPKNKEHFKGRWCWWRNDQLLTFLFWWQHCYNLLQHLVFLWLWHEWHQIYMTRDSDSYWALELESIVVHVQRAAIQHFFSG